MITRINIAFGLVAVATLATASANLAEPGNCRVLADEDGTTDEPYPAHALSPEESLRSFDVIFHAEVLVPSKTCSLGWCAGLRVLRKVKGETGTSNVLIRSMAATAKSPCGPNVFNRKGGKWLVFANRGTTPGGLSYLAADDESPTFRARGVPDFAALEASHRQLRARLDQAINERIGRTGAMR